MYKNILLGILSCLCGCFYSLNGQILDDSTKLLYNATTTQYQYGGDWLYQRSNASIIDTSIINFHNYQYYFKNGVLFQDLGNLGTALRKVYWTQNAQPGVNLGHEVFTEYMFNPERIPLYNSRSPFTRLSYIQGSRGLQTLDAEFSRNIKPNWNFGLDIRRMVAFKQIGVGERSEQQFNNYGFFAQTNYSSKSQAYKVYAWIDVMHHFHFETGGIKPDSGDIQDFLFDYKLENVELNRSLSTKSRLQSEDRRTYYRIYQELGVAKKGLRIFHQIDYSKRRLYYKDNNLESNFSYYPAIIYDSTATYDRSFYRLLENKAGVKGLVGPIYYQLYVRNRISNLSMIDSAESVFNVQEVFFGGVSEYRLKDHLYAGVEAQQGVSDFLYSGYVNTPWVKAKVSSMSSSPSLLQSHMRSNHAVWDKTFRNVNSTVVSLDGYLTWKNQELIPMFRFSAIDNLLYYDTAATAAQSEDRILFTQVGAKSKTGYKWIWLENEVMYTKRSGPDYWPVPEFMYAGRIYAYGRLFKKVMLVQTGIEAVRSSLYATPSYSTYLQQFYLTDPDDPLAIVNPYWQMNVFFNAYLKRAKFFLLVSHANQNLPNAGYFKTPYYTALGRTIQFGLTWMFYD